MSEIPQIVADQLGDNIVRAWIKEAIIDALDQLGVDVSDIETSVGTLSSSVDDKPESTHNHNLNDLSEKAYSSLTGTPEAAAGTDGSAVSSITSPSASAGADSIDLSALNSTLSTLETELNARLSALNDLVSAHNDLIDKLQAAGLMAT